MKPWPGRNHAPQWSEGELELFPPRTLSGYSGIADSLLLIPRRQHFLAHLLPCRNGAQCALVRQARGTFVLFPLLKNEDFRIFDGVRTWLRRSVGRRNVVTIAFGAGPWVKASRMVARITLLWSFICHQLSVRPNEVVGFCVFGTLHHSREF